MTKRRSTLWSRLSLTLHFTAAGFVIMVVGMAGIGWWVGEQIKEDVIKESAATTALYMDSFIAPNLQELGSSESLTPEHVRALSDLITSTSLGRQVVTFKVWNARGQVLFSSNPTLIGRTFPIDQDQSRSWRGEVVAGISDLQNPENVEDRRFGSRLLQIYSPVRMSDTGQIIAVAEFYEPVSHLEAEIGAAQTKSWLAVGAAMAAIYLLLVGFVQWASNTIGQQKTRLSLQVAQLTELLAQNRQLHARVQRAAASIATLDERFLRRISAELHDGPAQDLALTLLRLDTAISEHELCPLSKAGVCTCGTNLGMIQGPLQSALQETRAIATGLGLPDLEQVPLPDLLARVVRSHERRTGSTVTLAVEDLPEDVALPTKITVYRVIQEALNNAFRHARGLEQHVHVYRDVGSLAIEVRDHGPGFNLSQPIAWEEHLGLAGMRERVESLGGLFRIQSAVGEGTTVTAQLALEQEKE